MEKIDTMKRVSDDLTDTPFKNLTNQYLNFLEKINEKKEDSNKTPSKKDWKEKGNVALARALYSYFGTDSPTIWLTLTFRDKRIVNGINVGIGDRLERERFGEIIPVDNYQYQKEVGHQVGVQRCSKAIDSFFWKGQYIRTENKKPIYSNPVKDLASKFIYVVELGDKGQRRHIHALIALRDVRDIKLKNLIRIKFKKNLSLWQHHQGFYKLTELVNDEGLLMDKFNYISKQQYILKDFEKNHYQNYTELFGVYDWMNEYRKDLATEYLLKHKFMIKPKSVKVLKDIHKQLNKNDWE